MKGIDFLIHFGDIDDSYILEAESCKKMRNLSLEKWIGAAASLLLICMLSFSGYRYFTKEQPNPNIAPTSIEEFSRGIPVEVESSEELSFFKKIFEMIASFLE